MTKRIQYHLLQKLFRLFSFLADKSGGLSIFVKPKLVIGSLVIGLSVSSCQVKEQPKQDNKDKDISEMPTCYDTTFVPQDTIVEQQTKHPATAKPQSAKAIPIERSTCYKAVMPDPVNNQQIKCYESAAPANATRPETTEKTLPKNNKDCIITSCYITAPEPNEQNTSVQKDTQNKKTKK
jgi:hypothetical protein